MPVGIGLAVRRSSKHSKKGVLMKIPKKSSDFSITNVKIKSLIELKCMKKDWRETYSLKTRINLRIFSFLFPSVLKIIIRQDERR